jgi:hypothetical protein
MQPGPSPSIKTAYEPDRPEPKSQTPRDVHRLGENPNRQGSHAVDRDHAGVPA